MTSTFLLITLSHILGAHAGFHDEIMARAPQATDALPAACSYVDGALSFCSSVSPGFATMPLTDQAPCLCYSTTVWMPDVFDGAVYTCAQYAATALPESLYTDLTSLEGYCSAIGDVEHGGHPASAPATTTPPPAQATPAPISSVDIFTNSACSFVGFALSYCNSVSPGFTTMDPTSQAPCLCYSRANPTSTAWLPEVFDGAVLTCAEFVSSVASESLSIITGLESFCTDAGNVLGSGSAATNTEGNGVPLNTKTGGGSTVKQTTTPKTTPIIATPAPTTIIAPPTTTKSDGASRIQNKAWLFGFLASAISMIMLA